MIQQKNILSKQPRHIAIIMDGNGRWAKRKLLPRYAGHQAGLEAVRRTIKLSIEQGVEVLTLFAFSSENWKRPPQEVNLLMNLFMTALQREVKKLHKNNIRLRLIGDRKAFSEKLQQLIADAENLTKDNTAFTLVIAANYGGHWDIVDTAKRLALQVQQRSLNIDDIDENLFNSQINLSDLPKPDLFIRTAGEQRISNFLLWQLAYTELYFTNTLWPDFNEETFMDALKSFASRERRFGRTSEQLQNA
jgi:undecaprenyl diphosphate synthase